ncbi:MAG: FkbM family methyltransferase [Bacteroidota bacterium]
MNIIFRVEGGIGRNIAATAVCKAIRTQYPQAKLIVITAFPVVFLANPHIDRVCDANDLSYFYTDYIEGQEVKMLLHDPCRESSFINGEGQLISIWCAMSGIAYNGEQPQLFLTAAERSQYTPMFAAAKPIMVMQTNGGQPGRPHKYSWPRDMPLPAAQQVVNAFTPTHDIVHLRRADQPTLQGTTAFEGNFRAIAVLLSLSDKRLLIDSFAQHAAAALGKPSVVCWVGTSPAQFGYELHTNIIANAPTIKPELRHSVFTRYNATGQATEFPYNSEGEVFSAEAIIHALQHDDTHLKPAGVRNARITDRVSTAARKKSMVASRLSCLSGKVDLSDVKSILDIGSWHLGQSMEFADIFPTAGIHAFEPVPDSYQLCLTRLQEAGPAKQANIKVHNLALGTTEGEMPFYAVDPSQSSVPNVGASSMFKFMDGLNGTPFGQNLVQKEIKVKASTLDKWCSENAVSEIDIMWMDVQGAELHVLQGAEKALQNTKVIMTEVGLKPYYEGHTLKADIDSFLFARGFRELEGAFELNGFDYEANTIYVRS